MNRFWRVLVGPRGSLVVETGPDGDPVGSDLFHARAHSGSRPAAAVAGTGSLTPGRRPTVTQYSIGVGGATQVVSPPVVPQPRSERR